MTFQACTMQHNLTFVRIFCQFEKQAASQCYFIKKHACDLRKVKSTYSLIKHTLDHNANSYHFFSRIFRFFLLSQRICSVWSHLWPCFEFICMSRQLLWKESEDGPSLSQLPLVFLSVSQLVVSQSFSTGRHSKTSQVSQCLLIDTSI